MNGHQYSLVHLTNAACPPPEMIYIAARAGFDCVSLRSIPTRMRQNEPGVGESVTGRMPFALADCPELLAQTRRAAMETGVTIHDTENARIFDGVNVRDYTCLLYTPDAADDLTRDVSLILLCRCCIETAVSAQ